MWAKEVAPEAESELAKHEAETESLTEVKAESTDTSDPPTLRQPTRISRSPVRYTASAQLVVDPDNEAALTAAMELSPQLFTKAMKRLDADPWMAAMIGRSTPAPNTKSGDRQHGQPTRMRAQ
jgi:hypothetical protein